MFTNNYLNNSCGAYFTYNYLNSASFSSGSSTGGFTIKVSLNNACGSIERLYPFNVNNCFFSYSVYPNPAKEFINININTQKNEALPERIELFDQYSYKPVRTIRVRSTSSQKESVDEGRQIRIDVKDLSKGVYYLKFKGFIDKNLGNTSLRVLIE